MLYLDVARLLYFQENKFYLFDEDDNKEITFFKSLFESTLLLLKIYVNKSLYSTNKILLVLIYL